MLFFSFLLLPIMVAPSSLFITSQERISFLYQYGVFFLIFPSLFSSVLILFVLLIYFYIQYFFSPVLTSDYISITHMLITGFWIIKRAPTFLKHMLIDVEKIGSNLGSSCMSLESDVDICSLQSLVKKIRKLLIK